MSNDEAVERSPAEIAAIAALYQADRSSIVSGVASLRSVQGFTMIYIAAVASVWYSQSHRLGWLVAVLPVPVWIATSASVMFLVLARVRTESAIVLEGELFSSARFGLEDRDRIGLRRATAVAEPWKSENSRFPAVYLGLLWIAGTAGEALGILFTVVCIVKYAQSTWLWVPWAMFYSTWAALVVATIATLDAVAHASIRTSKTTQRHNP